MYQLIPLSTDPNQTFVVPLNIDNSVKDQLLTLRYNEIAGYWVMTLYDVNGNIILDSVALVTGNAPAGNILGQYAYMGLGSAYVVNASSVGVPNFPNSQDLGSDYVLIWGDTPAA
jgi:hypothetical protein